MSDYPANPLEKPGYRLEWHDEFDQAELDPNKWIPAYLPQWSSRQRSKPTYRLDGSLLHLEIQTEQQAWCPEFDGELRVSGLQTGVFSGPLGSSLGQHRFRPELVVREEQPPQRCYTPQYGYFECRAKASATPGFMSALWLIGFEEVAEESAEICMFEVFGKHISESNSTIGYGVHPWQDPNLRDEFYKDNLKIVASDFHIYALEWTPSHIDFYVDNQHIRRIRQSPRYPMQWMLTLYRFPESSTPDHPLPFSIDYLRAYQPESGY